jgi:hypothetical protein
VNQLILDGLALPVDDHGLGCGVAADFDIENRVVSSLREEDPRNLLGVHFKGYRVKPGTI